MLRVLVCGGRNYADRARLFGALDGMVIAELLIGDAMGADALALEWAHERGVDVRRFAADWKAYGRAAGPRRNETMLADGHPDLVVAFPGGVGTADMTRRAKKAGVPVMVL